MRDSIQESSGKSPQTFYSAEKPETRSAFPERLETNSSLPVQTSVVGVVYFSLLLGLLRVLGRN